MAPLDEPVDLSSALPEQFLSAAGSPHGVATMVGTAEQVRIELEQFVADHSVDELIVATYTHDPAMRQRSYHLLAGAWF